MQEIVAWCALNRASGLGAKKAQQLLATFGSPMAFFTVKDAEVRDALPNMDEKKWQGWRETFQQGGWQADIDWLNADNRHHIIPFHDERYPPLLKEISDPPVVLFVLGDAQLLQLPQLGIVGARNSTSGGEQICAQLSAQICAAGLLITSGMALGIDAIAHRSALASGGKTIAVVGTGLDRVYPARHYELAHSIAENGAIVSEFPIGTGVRPQHFPQRNRIISGLSLGILVIEASEKSGSLITARLATEQGREVFAVPGSIFNPLSKGCHALIRQGAKLTETATDILEELLPLAHASAQMVTQSERGKTSVNDSQLTDEQQKIISALGYDPVRKDELVERTQLTIEKISAILLMLVLDGYVQELPGGLYQRCQ